MFFRTVVVATLSLIIFAACSSEDVEPQGSIKFDSSKVSCVKTADETLDKYLKGEIKDSEINNFWDCTLEVVDLIHDLLDGVNEKEEIPVQELYRAIRDVISTKVQEEQISAFLKIKPLLVDGLGDRITKAELRELKSVLIELKTISLYFKPYAKSFMNQLKPSYEASVDEVKTTQRAMTEMMDDVSLIFAKHNNSYSFEDLRGLLQAFGVKKAQEWSLFVKRTKQLLVSDAEDILGTDWPIMFKQISAGMNIWLEVNGDSSHRQKKNLAPFVVKTSKKLSAILETGMAGQIVKDGFDVAEVSEFLVSFGKLGIVREESALNGQGLKQLWEVFNQKFLVKTEDKARFTKKDLAFISAQIKDWAQAENWIYTKSSQAKPIQCENKYAGTPVGELRLIDVCSPWRVKRNKERFLDLTDQGVSEALDTADLAQNNLFRIVIKQIVRAYKVNNRNGELNELNPKEIEAFFADFRPLLVGLGVVGENDKTFHSRLFQEADLFLPTSDGNGYLNSIEIAQYLKYALAAIEQGNRFRKDHLSECDEKLTQREEDDGQSIELLVQNRGCFDRVFAESYKDFFKNSPYLVKYLSESKSQVRREFLSNIYETVNLVISDQEINPDKTITLIGLFNYIETIMRRFDLNADGFVDFPEAKNSYHTVFKTTLEKIADKTIKNAFDEIAKLTEQRRKEKREETFTEAKKREWWTSREADKEGFSFSVFTYILTFGKIPLIKGASFYETPRFIAWVLADSYKATREVKEAQGFKSSRLELSEVFKVIRTLTR